MWNNDDGNIDDDDDDGVDCRDEYDVDTGVENDVTADRPLTMVIPDIFRCDYASL